MRKLFVPALTAALLLSAVCVYAADFWVAKPYTEWSPKDCDKMLSDSPWAKQVAVSMSGGGGGGGGGSRRGGGGGSRGSMGETGGAGGLGGSNTAPGVGSEPGSAGRGEQLEQMASQGGPAIQLHVLWVSATPVKQANMKKKYGSEVGSSEEAKKMIETEGNAYVLMVLMPGPGRGAAGAGMKDALKEATTLNVKGKDPIKAAQVEVSGGGAYFFFPKDKPITIDDKEVELVTKLGRDQIKCKFELKKMVIDGKLAL